MTDINPKVRGVLESLGQRLVHDGIPSFSDLEAELRGAQEAADARAEARASIKLATQLMSVAKVASAMADQPNREGMPTRDEALEPAIDLYLRAFQIASAGGDEALVNMARMQLSDCYVQSGQFAKALPLLEQTMSAYRTTREDVLAFNTAQLAGDCCLQMENDGAALTWYQEGLSLARAIDDPVEVQVQFGKIASALYNLKRYGEALAHYSTARDLLVLLSTDLDAQQRVKVHKHQFTVSAIPKLLAYVDERIAQTRQGPGRDLLRELPARMVAVASAALREQPVPDMSDWQVSHDLHSAVRAASDLVANLVDLPGDDPVDGDASERATLQKVGQLARRCAGDAVPDPQSMAHAARYLVQLTRLNEAKGIVRKAETITAGGAGPSAGGSFAHVLYLRSFIASDHLARPIVEPWTTIDLEELFACGMDRAPLIALGNPELERFGPGRAITTDENWRAVLRVLAVEAQMLLVAPAHTNGTSWEIEWTVTNKFLHKTVFVMPPATGTETAWWADNWSQLRKWAVRFGLNLPEYSEFGRLFRLTTEGQCDEIDFANVYNATDLRTALLYRLLFRTNISWDFAYALQQAIEQHRAETKTDSPAASAGERAASAGVSDATPDVLALLTELDDSTRMELSNWYYDAAQIPAAPAVVMYYETPFRMLWVEAADDLRDTLNRHSQGMPSPFTIAFFQQRVYYWLMDQQIEQVLAGDLTIDTIMSIRAKQMLSYRFVTIADAGTRERLLDLVVRGVSKHGAPLLDAPQRKAN